MDKDKTAVQQIISDLKRMDNGVAKLLAIGIEEKYLALEREQVVEAYVEGCKNTYGCDEPSEVWVDEDEANDYYTTKYSKQ